MAEVEIHWPEAVPTDQLLGAVADLEGAGIETECLVRPVRRGIATEVLVLVATPALQPMLKMVFERVGVDAYDAAKSFIKRLFGGDQDDGAPSTPAPAPAPAAVVFESTQTGAQFVFTPGLPDQAYRAAMEMPPTTIRGRWVWDTSSEKWLMFEAGTA